MLGPLCYPLLPRLLDKSLQAAGAAIAVNVSPAERLQLQHLNALCESSASRLPKIDGEAQQRLHILFIADDQILPASCLKGLQQSAVLAGDWASCTAQEYHVDKPEKTAVLLMGQAANEEKYNESPLVLSDRQVPSTLCRKWRGIIWDAWLSFTPFLEARVGAARAAFKSLGAIARSGAAPLAEIREVMKAKEAGTLFFGAMFLCFAPCWYDTLVKLQLEFERSILGTPPWTPPEVVRAIAGWSLNWGERVMLEVICFRAELWCTASDLLVHRVWLEAQGLPGRTFAQVSEEVLCTLTAHEVYDHPGWQGRASTGSSVLSSYRKSIQALLERKSCEAWKHSLAIRSNVGVQVSAQQWPVSVGEVLLRHDYLCTLHNADDFDRLRMGLVKLTAPRHNGRGTCCALCGGSVSGLAHILAVCSVTELARKEFLRLIDVEWQWVLRNALAGDWPVAVCSPHLGLERLVQAVRFASAVVKQLRGGAVKK